MSLHTRGEILQVRENGVVLKVEPLYEKYFK